MKKKYTFKVGDVVTLNTNGYRVFSRYERNYSSTTTKERISNLLSGAIIEKITSTNKYNLSSYNLSSLKYNKFAEVSFDSSGVWLCFLRKIKNPKKIEKVIRRIVAKKL